MKKLLLLYLVAFGFGLNGQGQDTAYWFNTNLSLGSFSDLPGLGLEANLSLSGHQYSFGYEYDQTTNFPGNWVGRAERQMIYFTPGGQFFLNEKLSFDYRLGLAFVGWRYQRESLWEGETDPGISRINSISFPLKFRINYDFSRNWGLYSEIAYYPFAVVEDQDYWLGRIGLRFGRLPQYYRRVKNEKQRLKVSQSKLAITANASYAQSLLGPSLDFGLGLVGKGKFVARYNLERSLSSGSDYFHAWYLQFGLQHQRERLAIGALGGLSSITKSEDFFGFNGNIGSSRSTSLQLVGQAYVQLLLTDRLRMEGFIRTTPFAPLEYLGGGLGIQVALPVL